MKPDNHLKALSVDEQIDYSDITATPSEPYDEWEDTATIELNDIARKNCEASPYWNRE